MNWPDVGDNLVRQIVRDFKHGQHIPWIDDPG